MQFSTIIAAVSFALVASATPIELVERTGSTPPTCSNNQKFACCNSVLNLVGLGCTAVDIIAVLNNNGCSGNQALACCSGNNQQTGLINVGLPTACVPVSLG